MARVRERGARPPCADRCRRAAPNRLLVEPSPNHGGTDLDYHGVELMNGEKMLRYRRTRADWLSLLLQGERIVANANSDSHTLSVIVGLPRTYVAAKDDATHQGLSAQFAEHSIERCYRTLVRGLPRADEGRIDRPIGRHPRDRKRMSVEAKAGKASVTNWRVRRRFREAMTSELEIRPETGRTHQIRVHLSSAGLPIVGDTVYGRARGNDAALGRPALHAAHLGFEHPATGRRLRFESPLPDDLIEWIADLGPEEVVPE